jgi:hypothetical protein
LVQLKNFITALLSILFLPLTANGTVAALSDNVTVSLITSSPSDDEVYTLYGHTAIRVKDDSARFDVVFNYGIFDFSKPNFIYRFAKGETDYILATYEFKREFADYQRRGSGVCEQVLNLLPEEKKALLQALEVNARPENRVYRYNFFFDNCATRPFVMIERSIGGTINYRHIREKETFRHAINNLTREHEWLTLGCDLVLGLPADRIMTQRERLFLPDNLKDYLTHSVIVREDVSQPVVLATNILADQQPKPEQKMNILSSPLACFGVLFVALLLITLLERFFKKYFRLIDSLLFIVAGTAGSIIFFLSFFSVHPGMFPNINIIWLHPLHLLGAVFFSLKKFKKPAFWYHFINFAVIFAMCVAWFFIPQHFNIAFIPLTAILLLRSGWALLRKKLMTE